MKIAAFLGLWAATAWSLPCQYDGNQFKVSWQGTWVSHRVMAGYSEAQWRCGDALAALYDGNDLVVFDGKEGKFRERSVASRYADALLAVRGERLGFYDGESVYAYTPDAGFVSERAHSYRYSQIGIAPGRLALYDGKSLWSFEGSRWESQKVRARYRHTRLEASPQFVVLYDGDDLWVWEKGETRPVSTHTRFQFYFPVVLVGDAALGFYDGARLHGYCRGKGFRSQKVEEDPFATGRLHKSGDVEITVRGTRHLLDVDTCQWN